MLEYLFINNRIPVYLHKNNRIRKEPIQNEENRKTVYPRYARSERKNNE